MLTNGFRSLAMASALTLCVLSMGQAAPPQLSAGADSSYALRYDGTIASWGGNDYGQLGDGTTTSTSLFVDVKNLNTVDSMACGGHSLAVLRDGSLWAWGANSWGTLGNGTTENSSVPIPVSSLSDVVAAARGADHSLALTRDGAVWAWGGNYNGQLGDGTKTQRLTPVPVSGISGVIAIAAAGSTSLAVTADGSVWGWGDNSVGELGQVTGSNVLQPTVIPNVGNIRAIAIGGGGHVLALDNDDAVWAWGFNWYGQLGNGTTSFSVKTPAMIAGLGTATAIAAGLWHSLALLSDGTVWAWGNNTYNQLGDGSYTDSAIPQQITEIEQVMAMAAGNLHNVVGTMDGSGWAWGLNDSGQLGDGNTEPTAQIVVVRGKNGPFRFRNPCMPPILYLLGAH